MTNFQVNNSDIPETLSVSDQTLRDLRAREASVVRSLAREGNYSGSLSLMVAGVCERALAGDLLARNEIASLMARRSDPHPSREEALVRERNILYAAKIVAIVAEHENSERAAAPSPAEILTTLAASKRITQDQLMELAVDYGDACETYGRMAADGETLERLGCLRDDCQRAKRKLAKSLEKYHDEIIDRVERRLSKSASRG